MMIGYKKTELALEFGLGGTFTKVVLQYNPVTR